MQQVNFTAGNSRQQILLYSIRAASGLSSSLNTVNAGPRMLRISLKSARAMKQTVSITEQTADGFIALYQNFPNLIRFSQGESDHSTIDSRPVIYVIFFPTIRAVFMKRLLINRPEISMVDVLKSDCKNISITAAACFRLLRK